MCSWHVNTVKKKNPRGSAYKRGDNVIDMNITFMVNAVCSASFLLHF